MQERTTVLMQCLFATGMLSVLWVTVGYSLTFTEGTPFIGGLDRFMLNGILPDTIAPLAATIPETVFVMFQCTFAVITPALIVGGPADRMKFSAMMLFLGVWLLLIYVPVAHMVWGPGGFRRGGRSSGGDSGLWFRFGRQCAGHRSCLRRGLLLGGDRSEVALRIR